MSGAVIGAVVGGCGGLGLVLVTTRLAASRRPDLAARVLPYLRDLPASGEHTWARPASDSPVSALTALARPALQRAARGLDSIIGGRESVRRRLERASSSLSVEQFRVSQLEWGIAAFVAAAVVGLLGPARAPGRAVPWLLVCAATATLGILLRENRLTSAVKTRESRMLLEFPVVADLLALSVAAGEGPVAALGRVVASCRGELPSELGRVLAEARAGTPLTTALDRLAARSGLAIVARFVDGFSVALARGTPLADVLSAQAADVRDAGRRSLIEAGARKEVLMMVPVVFLILPVTLLFAFFPGVIGLRLLAP
jgi:tight adherence protein C